MSCFVLFFHICQAKCCVFQIRRLRTGRTRKVQYLCQTSVIRLTSSPSSGGEKIGSFNTHIYIYILRLLCLVQAVV